MSGIKARARDVAAAGKKVAPNREKNPKNLYRRGTSPIWHYEVMVNGERLRGTTGTANTRDASRYAREVGEEERARQRAAGLYPVRAAPGRAAPARPARAWRGTMTLWQALERLMDDRPLKGKPKVTRERKARKVGALLGRETPISQIDDDAVSGMWKRLRDTHQFGDPKRPLLANAYVNDHVKVLRAAFRAAKRAKVQLPDEPEWEIYSLPVKARKRELTAEEQLRIEEGFREDMLPALDFLTETAARLKDGVELTWDQVDWIEGIIRLEVKGAKGAEVPITEEVAAILLEQDNHRSEMDPQAVFTFVYGGNSGPNRGGRLYERGKRYALTGALFYRVFKRTCKDVGVFNARPHDIRKTTGSQTLRATGNIVAAQQRLHHADIKTTREAYSYVSTDDTAGWMRTTSKFMAAKRSLAIQARRQQAEGGLRVGLLGSAAAAAISHRREISHGGDPDSQGSKGTWPPTPSRSSIPHVSEPENEVIPHHMQLKNLSHCYGSGKELLGSVNQMPGPEITIRFNAPNGTHPNANSHPFPAGDWGAFSIILGRDLSTPSALAKAFTRAMRNQGVARQIQRMVADPTEHAENDPEFDVRNSSATLG